MPICRTFRRISTLCQKRFEGSHGDDIDFENASFGLRNLAVDDENRAILKYSLDGKPEYENSQHSVLHGLSFKLSNQDKENSSAQL